MSRRAEFSKQTKLQAWLRAGGVCECGCRLKIIGGVEYDHYPVPAALGGTGDLSNCRVLAKKCHRRITSETDVPTIAKSTRGFEKRIGLRKTRRPFQKRHDPWGTHYE